MSEVIEEEQLIEEEDNEPKLQKPKRTLNEKQRETVKINLEKGRLALAEKKKKQKEEQEKLKNELIVKKAEKLVKQKTKKETQIKQIIGDVDSENESDNEVEKVYIKKKKAQKKKVIYLEESSSKEEIKTKQKPITTKQNISKPVNNHETRVPLGSMFKINFI
jgi:hypothetical protein